MKAKMPVVLCDIDGVLVKGVSPIPESADALRLLKKPLCELNSKKYPNDKT